MPRAFGWRALPENLSWPFQRHNSALGTCKAMMNDLDDPWPQVGTASDSAPCLVRVDPGYRSMLRLQTAFSGAIAIALALMVALAFLRQHLVAAGILGVALGIGLVLAVIFLPERRYRALGYSLSADELHVTYGVWVRYYTIVPVWRIQHIDAAQDPLARWFGLATLVVHTAGTLSSSVAIPGLRHSEAERLRDLIRESIRRHRS